MQVCKLLRISKFSETDFNSKQNLFTVYLLFIHSSSRPSTILFSNKAIEGGVNPNIHSAVHTIIAQTMIVGKYFGQGQSI